MWITLIQNYPSGVVHVNMDRVDMFHKAKDIATNKIDVTLIIFSGNIAKTDDCLEVVETPEQIRTLMGR